MVVILGSNTVRIRWKSVHRILLSQEDQIWLQFLKLTKTLLIIYRWWHTVTFLSNKVRIRWKFVHGVFLSQEDQIWHQFLKLTKTSLIIHTRWHAVAFPLNKIPIFNVFWPCLTWKWRYFIINWSISTNDVIFHLPDPKIFHIPIFSLFRSCLTGKWQYVIMYE